ncbi:Major facilitator superfamily domain, general substrate transporter-containing protein [Strongyloides ratti]|uniref:Major facilitator superfamily domain, general substrate transporter-containing protein n=1 Tax=Strongyloides ratti TaxID=34506 RepID=A0A090KWX0_STRRB|nr:Major facilitator superfamily domain, general substrate transporter-containing protein [Strongyloides ratti]CEF59702.1 Major facilitator superfamily domain, general substrate transporter-containing protein [Strongyloides ratti]
MASNDNVIVVRNTNQEEEEINGSQNDYNINLNSRSNNQNEINENNTTIFSKEILGCSIGHFYNDLCACMWFTYLMIFLEKVLHFPSEKSGFLMLIGQVADGLCTPVVGFLSDGGYIPKFLKPLGKRISWHLIGTIAVGITFPLIFSGCWFCQNSTGWLGVAYLILCITLFQFGWASVQISHLALIPEMTNCQAIRTSMQSFRYAFSMIANVLVFTLLYYLFQNDEEPEIIDENDLKNFSHAGLVLTIVGLSTSILFYLLTKSHWKIEVNTSNNEISILQNERNNIYNYDKMNWYKWFKNFQYYLITILYMLCRLSVNVSQVYFPFYIIITLKMSKNFVAILPLIIYISSFFSSIFIGIPWISKKLNRKATFMFGIFIGILNCVFFYCDHKNLTFVLVIFMGISQSILLVSSISITADLINKNTESGAFVYGSMSLFDKFSNGIVFQIIEIFNPSCTSMKGANIDCSQFYRDILIFIPGFCGIVMFIILLILLPQQIGKRNNNMEYEILIENDNNEN